MRNMTRKEIFKAAHKLAKAFKAKAGGKGDYVVYLKVSLIKIYAASIKSSKCRVFKVVNNTLRDAGLNCFIFNSVKTQQTHGLKEFRSKHEMMKAEKALDGAQYFGESFKKGGKVFAWVRSIRIDRVAY